MIKKLNEIMISINVALMIVIGIMVARKSLI
jgi:hypothetical protein